MIALTVYIRTLAPTITWRNDGADSGDFAAAVAVGGVPHPSGYPTYLLLARVFTQLPVGDVAYRLNLLSAGCAALAIIGVGLVIYHTLHTTLPHPASLGANASQQRLLAACAVAASLVFAFSDIFWSQAVITEVYTLNTFFAVVLLLATLHLNVSNQRWLVPAIFFIAGLSLGNHLSIVLFLPGLLWLFKAGWHWKLAINAGLAFFVGLSAYLIIPLRAAAVPPVNWAGAANLPDLIWLVSAAPYRHFVFALPWAFVPARIAAEGLLVTTAFLGWGVPVGLIGLWTMLHRDRRLAAGSITSFLLLSVYAIGYNTTDSYVYLLPALRLFSGWIGWGLFFGSRWLLTNLKMPPWLSNRVWLALLLLPLMSLSINFADQDISRDREALTYATENLQQVQPDALIIADNDPHTFALWYGLYGLKLRPDTAVIHIDLLEYAWYQATLRENYPYLQFSDEKGTPITSLTDVIQRNIHRSSLYLATLDSPPSLDGYQLEPAGDLYRVVPNSQ
ncbi:MAG: DUF2723 domain-containing protein [Anaerolineae bacterium]|nr:DUF2723 domain-containing protein [Anaerolineae bacterium]